MAYTKGEAPLLEFEDNRLQELVQYLQQELTAIEQSQGSQQEVPLVERHVEPIRPRVGMTVRADGSDWDPGDGAGTYVCTSLSPTVWTKLATAADLAALGDLAALDTVDTAQIEDGAVEFDKIQDLANRKILGNVSGGAAPPAELDFLDDDTMAANDPDAAASQQSIKAYVDTAVAGITPSNAFELIGEYSLSAEATDYTITDIDGYDLIRVTFFLVCSVNPSLRMRFGTSGGILSGASDYSWITSGNRVNATTPSSDPTDGAESTSEIYTLDNLQAWDADFPIHGEFTAMGLLGATEKLVLGRITGRNSTPDFVALQFGGAIHSTSVLTQLQFNWAGTMTGTILVEGRIV